MRVNHISIVGIFFWFVGTARCFCIRRSQIGNTDDEIGVFLTYFLPEINVGVLTKPMWNILRAGVIFKMMLVVILKATGQMLSKLFM